MTERMGYWVDLVDCLLDDGPGLHRVRLVVAQADLGQGPARPGPPRRALLPAVRHRSVRPRARAGLRDGRRPLGLRAVSADVRSVGGRGCTARVDDDAVDAGVQHRRRGQPRGDLRRRHAPDGRATRGRRAAGRDCARRGLEPSASPSRDATWSAGRYERPFDLVDIPDAHYVVLAEYVTTEDGTGLVHQSPAFGAEDLAVARRVRPAGRQPGPARTALRVPTYP